MGSHLQEEPKNMGAWRYVYPRFSTAFQQLRNVRPVPDAAHLPPTPQTHKHLTTTPPLPSQSPQDSRNLKYVGRPISASTATASFSIHQRELRDVLDAALTDDPEVPKA